MNSYHTLAPHNRMLIGSAPFFPEQVKQATQGYRAEMDALAAFIEECCIIGTRFEVSAASLYDAYKAWCDKGNEYTLTQRAFGMRLTERGFDRYPSTKGQMRYRGIGLKQTPNEAPN